MLAKQLEPNRSAMTDVILHAGTVLVVRAFKGRQ